MKTEELNRVFAFDDNAVRTAGTSENPLFVAADVCRALGLGNTSKALESVPEDEKGISQIDTLGGKQDLLVLKEPGLYRLIFRSDKPDAERFRKWVFSEVLPAIRKTGAYSVGEKASAEQLWQAYHAAKTGQVQMALLRALGFAANHSLKGSSGDWRVPEGVDPDTYWENYWASWYAKQKGKRREFPGSQSPPSTS